MHLANYIIADTTYEGTQISDKLRHIYWFPIIDVKTEDLITVYTKPGENVFEVINNGKNKHYYLFWGLKNFVWNNTGDIAILIKIKEWMTTKVNP